MPHGAFSAGPGARQCGCRCLRPCVLSRIVGHIMASVRGDLVAREVLARAFARSDSFARENNRCGMTEGPKERPGEWAKRGSQASAQLLIATAVNFTAR